MGFRPISAPIAGLIAATSIFVSPVFASGNVRFSGDLSGLVTDTAGRPQAGVLVMLLNKQERLLQRAATDREGNFSFDDLLPDLYSIRVSVASFFPASKDHIAVRPGMRSLLEVNLSRLFSSVQVVGTTPTVDGLMSDSWKWTLRADNAIRPILRILPEAKPSRDQTGETSIHASDHTPVFRDSRGLVRISASDGAPTAGQYGEADLGTQFAFATSVCGENRVSLTGNVGYAPMTGAPGAAIRTTYRRKFEDAEPALSVTMRQFYVPLRINQPVAPGTPADGLPSLRTLGFSFSDRKQISDALAIEYGSDMDMVSFIGHVQYFSPYAKLTYAIPRGTVDFTYTSGKPRPELQMSAADGSSELQRDLLAVSMMPRVTLLDSRAKVEYGEDIEAGVTQRFGSREFRVAGYRENVSNTALTIANPVPGMFQGDVMPDLFSSSGLFNAGRFETTGYTVSATQDFGQDYKLTAIFGSLGVLSPQNGSGDASNIQSADDLRSALRSQHRAAFDLRASGTVRATGTRFIASYEWTDYRSALPGPMFSTQSAHPEPGLNIMVRQPIPIFAGMPGRLEASAELRNLLAQGYMPISVGGQSILLVNTPRSFRGGLAFVF